MKDLQHRQQALLNDLEQNIEEIQSYLGNCSDLILRRFDVGENRVAVIHIDGISNTEMIQQFIIAPIQTLKNTERLSFSMLFRYLNEDTIAISDIKTETNWDNTLRSVLAGNTIILLDGVAEAMLAGTRKVEGRSIAESTTQTLVRGPKDSFTESLRTNTALIRMRMTDPQLRIDALQIGQVTHTDLAILYIQDIAKPSLVSAVKKRLKAISIDAILESGYLEPFIQDKKFSLFPTILNTERPDVVTANLLEGRVAIIINGTPFALIAPATFFQFFQSPEDYYQHYDISSLLRILRIGAFFAAMLAPAIYIALTTQHQAMLPTALVINIASQREGVPFPTIVEAFMMEIAFELLREAGIRMPRAVGQAGAIVGALILGQTAVQAGVVSAATIIVVSLTAIASLTIPYYNITITARLLRFLSMLTAGFLGLYGIVLFLLVLGTYICTISSFGVPYLTPVTPFILDEQKDTFLRLPIPFLRKRPSTGRRGNKMRMGQLSGEEDES
ncbi:spore germination protein [Ectobacillus sp. JY-23]|uniref:spore germination protein n=1 Tax=Ectobacillus sp. JY-23 TaxID=2933872 RepID=UPI001FF33BAF|nr:spore germination protein [Ectobacillus sp. JY-23]UOY94209.1 spore germination protein [Ectobacillus sp. JY-23]